ncbi:MAG: putative toxin-antitoxin system toxin component, PIN family [Firmicutes bacterium]|nr:putative toxin-antitoxin system toxin component, PIN family [Bacillota bacterium]
MKVIFDSNVLLSAGLFPNGGASQCVNYASEKFVIILTNTIIEEVKRVVERKFPKSLPLFERFFANLKYEYTYIPNEEIVTSKATISDQGDKHVLVSAIFAEAEVLITGDKHFFERVYDEVEVLSPSDFLAKY